MDPFPLTLVLLHVTGVFLYATRGRELIVVFVDPF
jgi:hypothetical protein